MLCVFLNGMCPSYFFLKFYFYFFSAEVPERNPWNFFPRRSRRGTLETLLLVFFSLRRLSSSVVFQWGSLRQTLDLSKTTNEKVPWRRPSNKLGNHIYKWRYHRDLGDISYLFHGDTISCLDESDWIMVVTNQVVFLDLPSRAARGTTVQLSLCFLLVT